MKFIKLFSILVIAGILFSCSGKSSDNSVIVGTKYGRVRGYTQDSVLVFKGIPYARAERFMPPREPLKWDTVMDCTEFGDICPQPEARKSNSYVPTDTSFTVSEDCLNLNIWTSARKDHDGRPVMVWLHGGGFDYGNSHHHVCFDGYKLTKEEDVVVVTVNHRLNCLGFLDLSAYDDRYRNSGNAGMEDLVAALKWIHDNIAAFGGDPDNVTLFGHGSGGVKALTLMAMPGAKGLFHKVIVQSGIIEGMSQPQSTARRVASETMKNANVRTPEELSKLPYKRLYEAASKAVADIDKERTDLNKYRVKFAPVVDGSLLPAPVFTDSSTNVDASIPVILGSTFSELTTKYYFEQDDAGDKLYDAHLLSEEELDNALEKAFGDKKEEVKLAFAMAYPDRPLCEVLTLDTVVRSHVLHMAHLLAKRGDAPIYVYLFSWVTPLHNGHVMSFRNSEMPFVFNNPESAEFSRAGGREAKRLARIMSRCWASFARSGNPNNSITPFWRRVNLNEGHTMIFDRDVRLEAYPDLKLLRLLQPEIVKDIHLYND